MLRRAIPPTVLALAIVFLSLSEAPAEMGPCRPVGEDNFVCGAGNGAAKIIPKTISPSKRLALAWRFTNRPPYSRPNEHDPNLENFIVRIEDGAVLAKTHGAYWHTGDRTAKANNVASWSPDSRFLIAEVGSVETENVELFTFVENDGAIGPLDLVKVFEPAVRARMGSSSAANQYSFRITYIPGIAIDAAGLIHASVYMARGGSGEGPAYDLTAQVTRGGDSLDVKVLSISEYLGPRLSVTVH
jgi:hypothetical protein